MGWWTESNQSGNSPFPFDSRLIKVLWVDTEQSYHHVRRVTQRIHTLAGFRMERSDHRLHVMTLRELEPRLRADKLYAAIELYRPKLVVIDGIADLQHNTNDLEESERIITRLMALSTEYRCHIMSVLHTNPNSDKARGHTGSALQRKAETVMYVHRVGDKSVVEPQFCRNEPFERFAFRVNQEALPELCELPSEDKAEDLCVKILRDEYGGAVERMVLINKVIEVSGSSRNAAQVRVHRAIKSGLVDFDTNTGIISLRALT